MELRSIKYSEGEGESPTWDISGILLGPINLIVGKNASGKTRMLNVIGNTAKILSSRYAGILNNGKHELELVKGSATSEERFTYTLNIKNSLVQKEALVIENKTFLERAVGKVGRIYHEEFGRLVDFEAPPDKIAAVVRRDKIQHPYLEELFQWVVGVRHFRFANSQPKMTAATIVGSQEKGIENIVQTDESESSLVPFVLSAHKEWGPSFNERVVDLMREVGFPVTEVGVTPLPLNLTAAPAFAMYIKEESVSVPINQFQMSDGMFRALSTLVHAAILERYKAFSCLLVDDIGEGLDFERSTRLISVLENMASRNSFQLIMTTNDRFVMNNTPLEYWSIINRTGSHVEVINKKNSPEVFEEFEGSGLNNFDFFSRKLYEKK